MRFAITALRAITALMLTLTVAAQDVPSWVIDGILMKESSSYRQRNAIVYVDRTRGKDGERGATQVTPDTFATYKVAGERWSDLDHPAFAVAFTERVLARYRAKYGSWDAAVRAWNRGPGNRNDAKGYAYLRSVRKAAALANN